MVEIGSINYLENKMKEIRIFVVRRNSLFVLSDVLEEREEIEFSHNEKLLST